MPLSACASLAGALASTVGRHACLHQDNAHSGAMMACALLLGSALHHRCLSTQQRACIVFHPLPVLSDPAIVTESHGHQRILETWPQAI